ncbi:MAG: hypothetical protein AAF799_31850 [Myxococcota bacterium]
MTDPKTDPLLQRWYSGGAPIIIQVAFKYGYGPAIVELNQKVYFNENLSFSRALMEAVQCVCLSACENQYCAIMHARGLMTHGFSLEEVKNLAMHQTLPESFEDKSKWEHTLRRVATIFREAQSSAHLYKTLAEFHSPEVIEEIGGIIAFSLLHKFLLELYSDEIQIEDEPSLFATVDQPRELISFFMTEGDRERVPTLTLCTLCKDVKSSQGWVPIESALNDIPADATFSHGLCERCYDRWLSLE